MTRKDRIKLDFTRNWRMPGKERLANWLKPSDSLKNTLRNGMTWIADEDMAIYTTADNFIENTILSTGTYEAEIAKLIRISLKPGYNALDIGANIGLQTIRMSQCCGSDGKVLSFEPLEYIQRKFKKNITLNNCTNVTLFPFALSDNNDTVEVKIDEQTWNQGTFSLKQTNAGTTSQQISVKKADEVPEIDALTHLQLVKIDVEGFEFHVLRGLKNTLIKHKPRIIFEYDVNYWNNNSESFTECYNFLTALNYTLFQITQVGCELLKDAAAAADGNIFCITND